MSDASEVKAPKLWMVRAGGDGWYLSHFLDDYVVSCSWSFPEPVDNYATVKDLQQAMVAHDDTQKHAQTSKQLYQFAKEMQPGDGVVTFDPTKKVYHLGMITGGYRYRAAWLPESSDRLPHTRMAIWEHVIDKDDLTDETAKALMRPMTIFAVRPDAAAELRSKI